MSNHDNNSLSVALSQCIAVILLGSVIVTAVTGFWGHWVVAGLSCVVLGWTAKAITG